MKQDQNLRFVIIGMGYLMEYIAPCYSKLLGDKKAEQMLGVTAEPQAVQTKAKATGIPVILNDNAGALRRMEPDIILFAPPPSLAAPLTESVLVPYFAECRAAGKELPMLFTFPPKPEGKYYQEQLGHDCKVVNILPNMISEICGRTCAEAGFTMVTLPESHTWQPEELDFIRRFWQPLGQVVFLTPAEVQVALAVSCSNQMLSEIFLDMQTALPEAYHESASALAEAARAYLMEKLGGARVLLDNDSHTGALAEFRHGAGRGFQNIVYCPVSTGISSGIVIDGRLFRGRYGWSGESGHMIVTPGEGIECGCGNRGCLMSWCSGSMIVRHIRSWIAAGEPTVMAELAGGAEKITAVHLRQACGLGDAMALRALGQMAKFLGIWLYNLYVTLNINCFIFGGGLTGFGELLFGRCLLYTSRRNTATSPMWACSSRRSTKSSPAPPCGALWARNDLTGVNLI